MKKPFSYSVLKFRPSYLLEEQINIGLLLVFPEEQKVVFLYPKKLSRVSKFYIDTDLSIVKKYLKSFEQKAYNTKISNENNIHKNFIPLDANSFYLTEPKSGLYSDINKIQEYYYQLYFKIYYQTKKNNKPQQKISSQKETKSELVLQRVLSKMSFDRDKNPETNLATTFQNEIKRIDNTKATFFHKGVMIPNSISETYFDYVWQNGKTNLVKIIGLNLDNEAKINEKAFRWYGEFTQLHHQFQVKNFQIDMLISKPEKKAFARTYNRAIEVLDSIKMKHNIIEENDIPRYIDNAMNSIRPISKNTFLHLE